MQRPIDIPTIVNLDRDKLETYTLDGPEYEALPRWLPITFDARPAVAAISSRYCPERSRGRTLIQATKSS